MVLDPVAVSVVDTIDTADLPDALWTQGPINYPTLIPRLGRFIYPLSRDTPNTYEAGLVDVKFDPDEKVLLSATYHQVLFESSSPGDEDMNMQVVYFPDDELIVCWSTTTIDGESTIRVYSRAVSYSGDSISFATGQGEMDFDTVGSNILDLHSMARTSDSIYVIWEGPEVDSFDTLYTHEIAPGDSGTAPLSNFLRVEDIDGDSDTNDPVTIFRCIRAGTSSVYVLYRITVDGDQRHYDGVVSGASIPINPTALDSSDILPPANIHPLNYDEGQWSVSGGWLMGAGGYTSLTGSFEGDPADTSYLEQWTRGFDDEIALNWLRILPGPVQRRTLRYYNLYTGEETYAVSGNGTNGSFLWGAASERRQFWFSLSGFGNKTVALWADPDFVVPSVNSWVVGYLIFGDPGSS